MTGSLIGNCLLGNCLLSLRKLLQVMMRSIKIASSSSCHNHMCRRCVHRCSLLYILPKMKHTNISFFSDRSFLTRFPTLQSSSPIPSSTLKHQSAAPFPSSHSLAPIHSSSHSDRPRWRPAATEPWSLKRKSKPTSHWLLLP